MGWFITSHNFQCSLWINKTWGMFTKRHGSSTSQEWGFTTEAPQDNTDNTGRCLEAKFHWICSSQLFTFAKLSKRAKIPKFPKANPLLHHLGLRIPKFVTKSCRCSSFTTLMSFEHNRFGLRVRVTWHVSKSVFRGSFSGFDLGGFRKAHFRTT